MLYDAVDDPEGTAVDDLLGRFADELAKTDAVANGDARVEADAVRSGAVGDVSVEEASAMLASDEDAPPADVIEAEIRDDLLLGMSSAVLDVEALAARVDLDLSPREIQQKVEGRTSTTLREYAALKLAIERRVP